MTPLHVASCILMIVFVNGVRSNSDRKLCDVRMWYLDLVSDGPLSGEISDAKKALQLKIEKMIEKYKDLGRKDGQVDCNILSMYNDLLATTKAQKSDERNDEHAKGSKDVDWKSLEATVKKQETQTQGSQNDDTDFDDTDLGDEGNIAGITHVQTEKVQVNIDRGGPTEGNKNKATTQEQRSSSQRKVSRNEVRREEYVFDPRKGYIKVLKELKSPEDEEPEKERDGEAKEENKTENIDVETGKQKTSENNDVGRVKESDKKNGEETPEKHDSEPIVLTKDQRDVSDKESTARKKMLDIIGEGRKHTEEAEVNTKLKNHVKKRYLDGSTEHKETIEEIDAGKTSETSSEDQDTYSDVSVLETIKDRCSQKDQCDQLCYYAFANGQCIEHYPDTIHNSIGLQTTVLPGVSGSEEASSVGKESNHENLAVVHLKYSEITELDSSSLLGSNNKDATDSKVSTSNPEEPGEIVKDPGSVQAGRGNKDNEQASMNMEDNENHNPVGTVHKSKSNGDTVQSDTRQQQQQAQLIDFTAEVHKFELLFQQRVSEYGSKIQALEIMIMKLENQLLTERVTKQNDSNAFSRLENQILKLENELLKLDQNYVTLKEENDMLRTRQGKYLELGHDQSKQHQLAANSTKHYALIAEQQSKISELTTLLRNHSLLFQTLHSKSNHLEEQNQILYQIVMNQTALISNIMKKVHELSEENIKQRQETQELRSKLAFGASSDRLLEKLDSLVSGATNIYRNVVDDGRTKETSPQNIFKHFPKLPNANYLEKTACSGRKSRYCVLFSIIMSSCIPYSTIYWSKCPYLFKDISQEKEQADTNINTVYLHEQNNRSVKAQKDTVDASSQNKQSLNRNGNEHVQDKGPPKEPGKSLDTKAEASLSRSAGTPKTPSSDTKAEISDSSTKASTGESDGAQAVEVKRKILYIPGDNLPKYKDCYGYYQDGETRNGMYKIYVVGLEKILPVYCDMKGGGWTVLYKRNSGGTDFYRGWDDYKSGFGGLYSDHWMGLERMHYLTNQDHYSMRVDLSDFNWEHAYAEYEDFWIDDESESYRLHIDKYSGDAGDGFEKHNNMKFTTFDRDNDLVMLELKDNDHNCANRFKGGWWYYKCYMANPTGIYYKRGEHATKFDGIAWKPWRKAYITMKEVVLKIRPVSAYY